MDETRYRFIVEWFDASVKLKREFLLTYFPLDDTLEMYDLQQKKLFLKRLKNETVNVSDLYIGSVVNVLSRQLLISGFGDKKTEEKFEHQSEVSLIIVKKEAFRSLGTILDVLQQNGLIVLKGRMIKIEGNSLYSKSSFIGQLEFSFAVFEIRRKDAVNVLKKLLDMESLVTEPLKAELGVLTQHCLVPTSFEMADAELEIFFPPVSEIHCNTAVIKDSTCCIVKPHIIRDGKAGKVIQSILDGGFHIMALEFVNFDLTTASEFLEVYKGTVPYYQEMVAQLMSGPAIAMEVTKENTTTIVQDFRELAGPVNAEVAKKLRPKTLRALYGHDQVKNAVHCTDLPEDGKIEVEYLFRIMPIGV